MLDAVSLKIGTIFEYKDEPCKVLSYKHTHLARGSADVRLKIRGLISGNVLPVVFGPSEKFPEVNLLKKAMQYLYKQDEVLYFMNPQTYHQVELKAETVGDNQDFLQEGETYDILYWDEDALDVLLPPKVDLEVIECDPGVKGNSAANMYKSAVLKGNIAVKVPLFIKVGEKIRIDTVRREYVERAK